MGVFFARQPEAWVGVDVGESGVGCVARLVGAVGGVEIGREGGFIMVLGGRGCWDVLIVLSAVGCEGWVPLGAFCFIGRGIVRAWCCVGEVLEWHRMGGYV